MSGRGLHDDPPRLALLRALAADPLGNSFLNGPLVFSTYKTQAFGLGSGSSAHRSAGALIRHDGKSFSLESFGEPVRKAVFGLRMSRTRRLGKTALRMACLHAAASVGIFGFSLWMAQGGLGVDATIPQHAFSLSGAVCFGFGAFVLSKHAWRRSSRVGVLPAGLSFQERLDLLHAVEEGSCGEGGAA